MKFTCSTCEKKLTKSYDDNPSVADFLGRPWYKVENGLNHLVIVCLHCGTIHDTSGSFLTGLFSGFQSMLKVHEDINPIELSLIVKKHTGGPSANSRKIVIKEMKLPEKVLDVLVEKNILGVAFKKGQT
jgi:hypothetical protein